MAFATIGELISKEGVFIDGDWVETKDQDQNGDVRLIQLADIADGYYKNKSARFLTNEKALKPNCTFLKKGDVLIARMPGPLGRACIFLGDTKERVTVVDVCVVRSGTEEISNKWIMYWVNSPRFRNTISSLQSGTTRRRISRGNLATITFPMPPPEQQKRIVAKIEELFSHIDAGIAALKKAKQLLKQYRQSVLKAAVTGELLGAEFPSDIYKSIEYGLKSLGQGWSPKCDKESSPSEDVWGVIKTTAVQSLEYLQDENKRLPKKLEPRAHLEVKVGDILLTRAGPRVRVGVCCLVKETRKKLMICDKVYRLRPDPKTILPEYL